MQYIFKLLPAALLLLTLRHGQAGEILFAPDFSSGLGGWKNTSLAWHDTQYSVRQEGSNCFVHAVAEKSCSALATRLNLVPPARLTLRWRWRVECVATNGSDLDVKTFDHAARVFVAFDTFIGLPHTLNYCWGNREKPGTTLEHPETSRAKIFVVESGDALAGRWVEEVRDVTADWQRFFPGESMPKIVGIGLMTDSDSLGTRLVADYASIELVAE